MSDSKDFARQSQIDDALNQIAALRRLHATLGETMVKSIALNQQVADSVKGLAAETLKIEARLSSLEHFTGKSGDL